MSLRKMIDMPSPQRDASPGRFRNRPEREARRSRKGCPECRRRKIKCDEKRPECSQCLKTGRGCRIIDGLFRPHAFSFSAPTQDSRPENQPITPSDNQVTSPEASEYREHTLPPVGFESGFQSPGIAFQSTPRLSDPFIARGSSQCAVSLESPLGQGQAASFRSGPNSDHTILSNVPIPGILDTPTHYSSSIPQVPTSLSEERPRDHAEITYFLRFFSEDSAKWMDASTAHFSYFSKYGALLSEKSALFGYAAAALAAKQVGQSRDPYSKTRNTPGQSRQTTNLAEAVDLGEPGLNFLWYGAKYYEKAIQLLFKQLSQEDCSTCDLSPRDIYGSDLINTGDAHNNLGEHEHASFVFQVLAACILCQYEDLSATKRAVTGHLDGIFKIFGPYLSAPAYFNSIPQVPQTKVAMESSFWYFALNDVLNAYDSQQPCRLDVSNLSLWRQMGLPLNEVGNLVIDCVDEQQREHVLLKALIRLMCMFFNSDVPKDAQWANVDTELDRWHAILPPSFLAVAHLPLPTSPYDAGDNATQDSLCQEVWFTTDVCAIAMGFYYMIKTILLANQPPELFLKKYTETSSDLLTAYNKLQRDLYRQTMKLIPIAQGRPSNTVRKHLVQPLYVAGRCLTDLRDRKCVLKLLYDIEGDLGIFTEYRMRDLLQEWSMPLETLDDIRISEE